MRNVESDFSTLHRLDQIVGGNVLRQSEIIEYQWPAIYFESRFSGSNVFFKIEDRHNKFRVLVDAAEIAIIEKPVSGQYQIIGLGAGAHTIRIEKLSESLNSSGKFFGFFADQPNRSFGHNMKIRQIEFIGDSYLVGYGNLAKSRECNSAQLYEFTDNTQSYGSIVARHFAADYRINAYSGIGLARNYNSNMPEKQFSYFYGRPVFANDYKSPSDDFRPQIIYIALGTNDFSTPIKPEEKWQNVDELKHDYIKRHFELLQSVRMANPNATIIIGANIGANENLLAARTKLIEDYSKIDANFHSITLPKLQNTGCHWHPNLTDHLSMAQILIGKIKDLKPKW